MKSRHLVDPELAPFIGRLSAAVELSAETLAAFRRRRAEAPPLPAPPVTGVTLAETLVPSKRAPDVRVLVYRPHADVPVPAVLHLHGGGYVVGAPEMNDLTNRYLSATLRCVVVSVDYRLAPEAPFPAPLEDCYAALVWMYKNAARLGINPGRIALRGESAGGGLAAGLALLARDRNEVPLVFQLLVYPSLDDRTGSPEGGVPNPYAGEYAVTAAGNRFSWSSMLGHDPGAKETSPYAAAARAVDLSGLPPAFIQVGALDLFVDENIDYARRLLRAGVPTELHVYPGVFHGFDVLSDTHVRRSFDRDALEAMRRALHPVTALEQAT
jgi:acetyl esterase/lipase